MADMQIPVRLGRKPCEDIFKPPLPEIFFNDFFNKIQTFFFAHSGSLRGVEFA
jgi:hypothetical protein